MLLFPRGRAGLSFSVPACGFADAVAEDPEEDEEELVEVIVLGPLSRKPSLYIARPQPTRVMFPAAIPMYGLRLSFAKSTSLQN